MLIKRLIPLHDRVVVIRVDEEAEAVANGTSYSLATPDNAKQKPQIGQVIEVGTGKVMQDGSVRPIPLAIGDRVLFGRYGGAEHEMEDTEYLILREDEIMAKVVMEEVADDDGTQADRGY